jgi:hypothetical protein
LGFPDKRDHDLPGNADSARWKSFPIHAARPRRHSGGGPTGDWSLGVATLRSSIRSMLLSRELVRGVGSDGRNLMTVGVEGFAVTQHAPGDPGQLVGQRGG